LVDDNGYIEPVETLAWLLQGGVVGRRCCVSTGVIGVVGEASWPRFAAKARRRFFRSFASFKRLSLACSDVS
jgi:hypothetical protein